MDFEINLNLPFDKYIDQKLWEFTQLNEASSPQKKSKNIEQNPIKGLRSSSKNLDLIHIA